MRWVRQRVLCYHKICDIGKDWNNITTSIDAFHEELEFLNNKYGFSSPDIIGKEGNGEGIVLTFDDGFDDNYFNVLPVIEQMKIPSLFFISTEQIDKSKENWCNELVWLILEGEVYPESIILPIEGEYKKYETKTLNQRLVLYRIIRKGMAGMEIDERNFLLDILRTWACVSRRELRTSHYMLSQKNLLALAQSKYVTIGCHTVTHRSLGLLTEEEQYREIVESKCYLENLLGKKIRHFAYPFGGIDDYNETTLNIVREVGFSQAYSTTYKRRSKEKTLFEIPRICIHGNSVDEFKQTLEKYKFKTSYYYGNQV